MDIQSLLLQINQKLDLLLKAHGLNDKIHSEGSDSEKEDYELGRELARSMGPIRSDERD